MFPFLRLRVWFYMMSGMAALLVAAGISLPAIAAAGARHEKFAVYYSDRLPAERFTPYDLLVFDRQHHPPLQLLKEDGKTLLGYISLGEIEKNSPYFSELQRDGMVLRENKNWPGSWVIDIRNPLWAKIVIERIIPQLLIGGFNGAFFDTLDSPIELEEEHPEKYHGMKAAAVRLIEAVRMHYPRLKIMVNRAYPILPQIAPHIDMVMGESVAGDYDFNKKTYGRVQDALYRQQVRWLQDVKAQDPRIKIYTLDYADPHDKKAIRELYRKQHANGFIPYVATVGLDELVDDGDSRP